jgi:hypothetical protein
MGADEGKEGREGPLTPRTSVFCELAGKVAREECPDSRWEVAKDGRRVLKATLDGNSLLGLFPADTKFSNALKFFGEAADNSAQYPVIYGETENGLTTRIVNNEPNGQFIIASYRLPVLSEEPLAAVLPEQQQEPAHFDVLLDRLEGFLSKAGQDVGEQGKRLEHFVKDEARPKVEQAASRLTA